LYRESLGEEHEGIDVAEVEKVGFGPLNVLKLIFVFFGHSIPELLAQTRFFLEGQTHDLEGLRSAGINLS
jgi:hypothetical protein